VGLFVFLKVTEKLQLLRVRQRRLRQALSRFGSGSNQGNGSNSSGSSSYAPEAADSTAEAALAVARSSNTSDALPVAVSCDALNQGSVSALPEATCRSTLNPETAAWEVSQEQSDDAFQELQLLT